MIIAGSYIFQDWSANRNSVKGRIVMIMFRFASVISRYLILKIILCWYLILYKVVIGWIFNIEISSKVKIGKGLKLVYGHGSVVNGTAQIGENCTLRHLTTIGCKILEDGTSGPSPKIGNNVDIGVNANIIGGICIGDDVIIGAGSVVTKDVQSHCVIGGNPAVILKMIYKYPIIAYDKQDNLEAAT